MFFMAISARCQRYLLDYEERLLTSAIFEVNGVVRIGPVGLGRCAPETALPSLMAVKLQEGWGEHGQPSSRDRGLRGVDEHASPRWRVAP